MEIFSNQKESRTLQLKDLNKELMNLNTDLQPIISIKNKRPLLLMTLMSLKEPF